MSLIGELKRRGVFRAMIAYTIVAWLLIQVADIMLDAFEAPAWLFRAFILLLAIGFLVALVLSWIFDISAKGIVREDAMSAGQSSVRPAQRNLNLVVISLLLAAVALFAVDKFWLRSNYEAIPGRGDTLGASIAVLPFANRSSLPEDAYFADGIHDDLLTTLARIKSINVTSRTSVMRYRDSDKSIPEIGSELGVDTILEGGVQRAGSQVRINAQLIDAHSDTHLWADTFDRELSPANIFSIQSDITRAIADALHSQLTPVDEKRLEAVPTQNLEAYESYLQGRSALNERSDASLLAAVTNFENAIELDAGFAGGHAGLCEARLGLYTSTRDTSHFNNAEAACHEALLLDSDAMEVHIALGALYRHHGDYDRAELELRQAAAIDPENVEALIELSLTLGLQGHAAEAKALLERAEILQPAYWPVHDALTSYYRNHDSGPDRFEQSVKHAMRVVELTPESASAWNNLGTAYHGLEQYDAAKSAWDRALELNPTRTAYTNRGLQYYYDGRFQDAMEMQSRALEFAPSDHRLWGRLAESGRHAKMDELQVREAYEKAIRYATEQLGINRRDWRTRALLGTYYAFTGKSSDARSMLDEALKESKREPEALLYDALVRQQSGDIDTCLDSLEEAVSKNDAYRYYVQQDPDLARLSDQPRFRQLTATDK